MLLVPRSGTVCHRRSHQRHHWTPFAGVWWLICSPCHIRTYNYRNWLTSVSIDLAVNPYLGHFKNSWLINWLILSFPRYYDLMVESRSLLPFLSTPVPCSLVWILKLYGMWKLGLKKLELLPDATVIRFDALPACDGRTDRQTDMRLWLSRAVA